MENRFDRFNRSIMITGTIHTPAGEIKQVATKLNRRDYIGAVKVRWLIGRNNYKIEPGLYAVGNPDRQVLSQNLFKRL